MLQQITIRQHWNMMNVIFFSWSLLTWHQKLTTCGGMKVWWDTWKMIHKFTSSVTYNLLMGAHGGRTQSARACLFFFFPFIPNPSPKKPRFVVHLNFQPRNGGSQRERGYCRQIFCSKTWAEGRHTQSQRERG